MKVAVLSDIHGNLEALQACLEHARRQGAAAYVFLGDLVGYGADPIACLELLAGYSQRGAIFVRGNHDEAVLGGLCEDMTFAAREVTYWTRASLGESERAFLASLPLIFRHDQTLFVHADAVAPQAWTYLLRTADVERSMNAAQAGVTFSGHVHQPTLFFSHGRGVRRFHPVPGVSISLLPGRRWQAIVGSVGQPRDGNTAAAYALFDDEKRLLTFYRVPYDHFRAARKIVAAGLPSELAQRLLLGV